MKKMPRRDKLKIYGDILFSLNDSRHEKIVLSHIQHKTNVPFDRLKIYLSELEDLGLIKQDPKLYLTDKGKQYLSDYEKVLEFMNRMGLSYS